MNGMGAMGNEKVWVDRHGLAVPVGFSTHYRLRGPALARMSPLEYASLVTVVQKTREEFEKFEELEAAGRVDYEELARVGRRPNERFEFHPAHPLFGAAHQKLNSKVAVPMHVGHSIPREPKQKGEGHKVNNVWLKARETFAVFVMAVFVPPLSARRASRHVP